MTTATTMNGNVRKSLSEQIDRLDTILDGLAEGLSGAVADAVRDSVGRAVQEAVQAVLIEVLGNPAVLEKLRGNVAPPPTPKPPKPDRARQLVRQATSWICTGWAKIREACAVTALQVRRAARVVHQHSRLLWTFRTPLLAAVGTGAVLGLTAFCAGPWAAATAGSLAGFTAATATQLALTLRRVLARFTMSDAPP